MMRTVAPLLIAFSALSASSADTAAPSPLASGEYTFAVKFAEHPGVSGGRVTVEIRERHIRVVSKPKSSVFPAGLVEEGTLLWHATSARWIIGQSDADAAAPDVGACSDGPSIIDVEQRIYWTC